MRGLVEKDRALEQIAQGPFGKSPHVFTWEENESPYQVVASALKERGLATGRIGIEERVTFVFAQGIANAVPAATIASATEVTAGCRMIKSPAEIALMRLASSGSPTRPSPRPITVANSSQLLSGV